MNEAQINEIYRLQEKNAGREMDERELKIEKCSSHMFEGFINHLKQQFSHEGKICLYEMAKPLGGDYTRTNPCDKTAGSDWEEAAQRFYNKVGFNFRNSMDIKKSKDGAIFRMEYRLHKSN